MAKDEPTGNVATKTMYSDLVPSNLEICLQGMLLEEGCCPASGTPDHGGKKTLSFGRAAETRNDASASGGGKTSMDGTCSEIARLVASKIRLQFLLPTCDGPKDGQCHTRRHGILSCGNIDISWLGM
jgi:hypothetical protein